MGAVGREAINEYFANVRAEYGCLVFITVVVMGTSAASLNFGLT